MTVCELLPDVSLLVPVEGGGGGEVLNWALLDPERPGGLGLALVLVVGVV